MKKYKEYVVLVPFGTDGKGGLPKYEIRGGFFVDKQTALCYAKREWAGAIVARVRGDVLEGRQRAIVEGQERGE